MAQFEDLTPYSYLSGRYITQGAALNIGWLGDKDSFEPGPVPPEFVGRLNALTQQPVNLCRGWHTCWCTYAIGNGEIRVTGRDGVVYAAPVLIAHYVSAHGYQPPQVFVDAVMAQSASTNAVDPVGGSDHEPTPRGAL
jgi:hypothetical protein